MWMRGHGRRLTGIDATIPTPPPQRAGPFRTPSTPPGRRHPFWTSGFVIGQSIIRIGNRRDGPAQHATLWIFAIRRCSQDTSAPLPKFVIHRSNLWHELRKQKGTSKYMILVPLIDLKFLNERAASDAGTSNRRH